MKSGGHKIKADPKAGKKDQAARGSQSHRAKNGLAHKIGGNSVKAFKEGGRDKFMTKPKSPEPENVGRKTRPAAHSPVGAAKAKARRKLVAKLSDKVI